LKRHILSRSVIIVLLLVCAIAAFWYIEAGNFSEVNVQGVYSANVGGETSTLILGADHKFQQTLNAGGAQVRADGTWRLFPPDSQSHIAFSSTFLLMPGQKKAADGTAYGSLRNNFGLLLISLYSDTVGPTFHKRWFH
jgi:hypothetical protein